MIFLSHNSKDKRIVEPFANKLAEAFGREKVFYDSWSIQPGDGIIDKMESGLTEAKYFFFFVSENSLQSGMVKLEWQNAIMKATNGKVKFIPIRLDKSKMPTLLTQTLYLDVYQNGFDVVLRQMIDVINGVNTYRSSAETYENIKVKVKINEKEAEILFYAETYMEPILYVSNTVNSHCSISVISLISEKIRKKQLAGEIQQPYQKIVTYETEKFSDLSIKEAYEYLKTLPEFEGAEDVFEDKNNSV